MQVFLLATDETPKLPEELPVLPLFFRSDAHVFPTWLKGVRPTGTADYSSLWAEEWRSE